MSQKTWMGVPCWSKVDWSRSHEPSQSETEKQEAGKHILGTFLPYFPGSLLWTFLPFIDHLLKSRTLVLAQVYCRIAYSCKKRKTEYLQIESSLFSCKQPNTVMTHEHQGTIKEPISPTSPLCHCETSWCKGRARAPAITSQTETGGMEKKKQIAPL